MDKHLVDLLTSSVMVLGDVIMKLSDDDEYLPELQEIYEIYADALWYINNDNA